MEKLDCKTEDFLAYDLKGQPKILSRSGSFVQRAQEEKLQNEQKAFTRGPIHTQASSRPSGNTRFFGSFEQYRRQLAPKTTAS